MTSVTLRAINELHFGFSTITASSEAVLLRLFGFPLYLLKKTKPKTYSKYDKGICLSIILNDQSIDVSHGRNGVTSTEPR